MAYCAVSDVQAMMGQTFSTTSKPTVAEVTAAIDETAAELDGVASAAGYNVPVSGDASTLIMKRMNAYGASVNAWHSGVIADNEPARVIYWREQYANFITRLRKGEQTLPCNTPTPSPHTGSASRRYGCLLPARAPHTPRPLQAHRCYVRRPQTA